MAPSTICKAIGAVKDKASIGLAKVSSSTALAELEVVIVKATRHDEYPAEEKHVRDILTLTSYSCLNVATCVALLARRLAKTRSWAVALKTLILVHRLLADGDPAFEEEIFFATRRGTRMLNMSDFRNGEWECSAFVRSYSRYLDERLDYKMQGRRRKRGFLPASGRTVAAEMEDERDPAVSTPVREMRTERLFVKAHHLQNLLDRFLASRPTGAAKTNRIVAMALYPMVRESFLIYYDLAEIIAAFVDRFMELPVSDCVRTHDLFSNFSKQFEELDAFYFWSRSAGVARSSDYPEIEHITQKKLEIMDGFIHERTALTALRPSQEINPAPDNDLSQVNALPAKLSWEENSVAEQKELSSVECKEAGQEGTELNDLRRPASPPKEEGTNLPDLREDVPTTDRDADKLALALFEGETTAASANLFQDTADWEKELFESANKFEGNKSEIAGEFNKLMLNEMYEHAKASAANGNAGCMGSPSSMAMVGPGKPQMLALPAPAGGCVVPSEDSFMASAAVPPPVWVQMSELERKQHLLLEEQRRWQLYARGGMQGNLPPTMYPIGVYQQRFRTEFVGGNFLA